MIAERAGLSPGGVFTTFDDKVAILAHILAEDRERLFEEITRLVSTLDGPIRQRIQRLVELAHQHEWPRLRMVVAYIGASYGWSRPLEEEHRRLHRQLALVIAGLIREGAERGELRRDIEIETMVEVISAVYQRNYRSAYYSGFDTEDLNARISRQLDLLFDGARPR